MTDYDVTLEWADGRTESIVVADDETVLEAAQRARIRLPYDCRSGTCITCVGRLIGLEDGDGGRDENEPIDAAEGFTYRRQPQALTEQEGADGYVLLCIASPRADCRLEVGPRVRAEVGDSPWA
ncbi:2Fe-2S iron-sulfur cluster-binding protein [Natrinema versiforme]|uniref:Ferredoxin n=1 Tax=Natrinema versiforme JCM 10478 TaxID=1227496 RepID=L9XVK6_9EURY|nr:2Fe-2S iron-sulfur cluster-binding protein [Natrinema versiforme]ELY65874.1 ferredoxin [Natrinema versiforme JCM 10478]